MNKESVNTRLSPKSVITVYSDKGGYKYYLEERKVKVFKGKMALLAPIALADDALKSLANSYMKSNSTNMEIGGMIASHLLYAINKPGQTVIMWYRPEMKRALNFSASLEIKDSTDVHIPAVLFLLVNNTLYVFALMTSERPSNTTKLYNAPFFNTYTDGKVCLGSANVGRYKLATFEKEANRFETGFFMAEQTHGTITSCKTPLKALWPKVIKSNKPFPSKTELVQHAKYKTVGELINKVIGNASTSPEND